MGAGEAGAEVTLTSEQADAAYDRVVQLTGLDRKLAASLFWEAVGRRQKVKAAKVSKSEALAIVLAAIGVVEGYGPDFLARNTVSSLLHSAAAKLSYTDARLALAEQSAKASRPAALQSSPSARTQQPLRQAVIKGSGKALWIVQPATLSDILRKAEATPDDLSHAIAWAGRKYATVAQASPAEVELALMQQAAANRRRRELIAERGEPARHIPGGPGRLGGALALNGSVGLAQAHIDRLKAEHEIDEGAIMGLLMATSDEIAPGAKLDLEQLGSGLQAAFECEVDAYVSRRFPRRVSAAATAGTAETSAVQAPRFKTVAELRAEADEHRKWMAAQMAKARGMPPRLS